MLNNKLKNLGKKLKITKPSEAEGEAEGVITNPEVIRDELKSNSVDAILGNALGKIKGYANEPSKNVQKLLEDIQEGMLVMLGNKESEQQGNKVRGQQGNKGREQQRNWQSLL